ncbi:PLDc N-terminal domain-containing protein [Treponema sp. OMZ 787]|uniref:PLDc N-terminal domain-containing protein n=1 Tax=Treponema sp. OMZ 787 TaxID=2563669 RepID=UPI0020A4E681|nr:PLDc N-terminal domain-containing protein [Treponema sp. OMZ 787]UTC62610.1 PLDc N-terminal domain-containing protein [Treponema sp. OMZ 787]
MFFVSLIAVIITASIFALAARILIAYWVYKDAQERNDEALVWVLIVFFLSAVLGLILYLVAARKSRRIKCSSCGFTQAAGIPYCGSCGKQMPPISEAVNKRNKANLWPLITAGILTLLSLIFSIILSIYIFKSAVNGEIENFFPNSDIALMQSQTNFNNLYRASFKYKTSEKFSTFTIKEGKNLKCSWNIDSGNISVEISFGEKIIKSFDNNKDGNILNTEIDMSDYVGKKIKLKIKCSKASGSFEFNAR